MGLACGQTGSAGDTGPASEFYQGKTLSIVVGSGAGISVVLANCPLLVNRARVEKLEGMAIVLRTEFLKKL